MSIELVGVDTIRKAQEGDQDAINQILKNYENFIFLKSRDYFLLGADKEDILQEGMIGLIKAIKAYKEDKDTSFNTFAILCIKRQIITAIKASNAQKNMVLNAAISNSLETEDGKEVNYSKGLSTGITYNPEELYIGKEQVTEFKSYLEKSFSQIEKEVFFYMVNGYNYREIADRLGKSLKTIDNAMQRIKRKSEEWITRNN